jgi:preprotein translocase subunit SecF
MRLIGDTNIQFVSKRRLFFAISGLMMLASIAVVLIRGGFNYGVDFTGGSLVQVHFAQPVSTDAMRGALEKMGEGGAGLQRYERGDFLIRAKAREFPGKETFSTVLSRQLESSFPGNQVEILRDEMVGPQVSKELQGKVLLAVALGLIGILVYVSFRFDVRFGTGAVLSLVHDTVMTLGFVALFNKEVTITLIAAVLTMIGFSVNDSIVVSDRIREDIRKMRKESFFDVCNQAINKTLGRTLITSLTVLFVSLSLLVFGAASIRDFAFVMTVGILVGVYSSVFIVVNFVVEWEQKFPSKRRR